MLTFLTGDDRVQLSRHLFSQVCTASNNGVEHQVIIVPEQFSHEAERQLCKIGGAAINRSAEVLSMSRLSDRAAAACGGAAKSYLDKGGQLLAMASAAEQVSSKIKLYASVLKKPEFLASILQMIEEFRSYCLEPQVLLDASKWTEGIFSQKLEELGFLYEAYLSVCANGKADPSDKLLQLNEHLRETSWGSDFTFYIDGYSDFTGSELQVLEALISQAKDVMIAMVVPKKALHLTDFSSVTMRVLKTFAQKWGIPTKVIPFTCHSDRLPDIQCLIDAMFSSEQLQPCESHHVLLQHAASPEDECCSVVCKIKQLLLAGARCREISIAYTDPVLYRASLISACSAAEIPFYASGEKPLNSAPIIRAILNALNAAVGSLDYDDVSLYLKSGLPELDREKCDRLDNYAYLWNLHGKQWEHCLEKHPRGFGLTWEDSDRQLLEELEADRKYVLEPLLLLRKRLYAAPRTGMMVEIFYDFLENLHLRERLEQQANTLLNAGEGQLAQELSQLFQIISQSLEQLWLILGDTVRSPEDFSQLYEMLLSQYQVATIPVGLDQVQISNLPDLRYMQTKYLFVLGANDGKFPSYKSAEGVLTEEERQQLIHHGIPLAPGRSEQVEREISWIHSALSSCEQFLSLSYSGEQPSWLFRRANSLYPDSFHGETSLAFYDPKMYAAWIVRNHYNSGNSGKNSSSLYDLQSSLAAHSQYHFTSLREPTVQALYGRKINLSASKIDKYASCRFLFFLTYGLRAHPIKQAKLDAPAFGTFVHEVLEHTVMKVKELGGFYLVNESQILDIASSEINTYAAQYFPEQTLREAYLFNRSKAEIMEVVRDLWSELHRSKFQPAACELGFSEDGRMPPIEIAGEKAVCRLTGYVDRMDLYEEAGKKYVRVVDYKTGPKAFDYTDILNGAGLQMLIYLFALHQYGGDYLGLGSLEPAGVLYMPAKSQFVLTASMPNKQEIQNIQQKAKRRQGLIRSDDNLLAAMEEDPDHPVYMPYDVKKSGPQGDLADRRQMYLLERHVLRSIARMADGILSGDVGPNPIVRGQMSSCTYCDYKTVCHHDLGTQTIRELSKTSAALFWNKLEEEEQNHG